MKKILLILVFLSLLPLRNRKTNIFWCKNIIVMSKEALNINHKLKVKDITDYYESIDLSNILSSNQTLFKAYDIKFQNKKETLNLNNGNFIIKIKIKKKFQNEKFTVAYLESNLIKETFKPKVKDNYLIFTTSHLSHYMIIKT